jgi:polysaccharide deacetylase 2 family uncharacterized protein YibQ
MRTCSSGGWPEIGLIYLSFLVLLLSAALSLQYYSDKTAEKARRPSVLESERQSEHSSLELQEQIMEAIQLLAEKNGWEPRQDQDPPSLLVRRGSDRTTRPATVEESFYLSAALTLEELKAYTEQIQACPDLIKLGADITKINWRQVGFEPIMQVEIGADKDEPGLVRVSFFRREKSRKPGSGWRMTAKHSILDSDLSFWINPDLLQTKPRPFYPPPTFEPLPELIPKPESTIKPRVALIIDDVGFVNQPTLDYFSLPYPLTFAVLPGGEFSVSHAKEALNKGFEVILHLPLEPLDSNVECGPGGITSRMTSSEALRQLRANLESVPGVTGVNNHMGSKATQDPVLLGLIMGELKKRDLFFVDSRTVATSVAWEVAVQYGVAWTVRDVFIDHYGVEGIEEQMEILLNKALTNGTAVGIAHARPGVAQAIARCLPRFIQAGVEIVPVSSLIKEDY